MYEVKAKKSASGIIVALEGKISFSNANEVFKNIVTEIKSQNSFRLDLEAVDYFDIAAASILLEVKYQCTRQKSPFSIVNTPDNISGLLSTLNFDNLALGREVAPRKSEGFILRLGQWSYTFANDMRETLIFLGDLMLALGYSIKHPRSVRWKDVLFYLERVGVDAVPIMMLIQFLIGVTLAFLGASQLKQFGADIYVADMVALAMVYEIGPLMTGIMVAGRSGAAFAAEIGTMKVSEEVDALVAMGFNPQRFLVVPKIIAVVIAIPGLLMLSNVVGIFGGALVASNLLDIHAVSYYNQTYEALSFSAIFEGLTKSIIFGFLLATISCMRGFQVDGGAESVGHYTTSAVVSSIFLIIVANAIFTILFQCT